MESPALEGERGVAQSNNRHTTGFHILFTAIGLTFLPFWGDVETILQ